MSRQSEIIKYPAELLAFIHQCLDDPKITQSETIKKVNQLITDKYLDENELTTGTLGRYAKKRRANFEKAIQVMAQQKAQRDEFFERFGNEGLDNAGRYAAEMLYSSMMQLQTATSALQNAAANDEESPISLGELDVQSKIVSRMAGAIGSLEKSLSENKSRVDAIKAEAVEKAREEDIEKLKSLGQERVDGKPIIDEATIKAVREGLYGIYADD